MGDLIFCSARKFRASNGQVVFMMESKVFSPANILIPAAADLEKWSVIACDQHTSEPEYWGRVEAKVGDAPSSLRITLPEIYLDDADEAARIAQINATMRDYISGDIFAEHRSSYVYIERVTSPGKIRRGLLGKIDLEQYDYGAHSRSAVRPTEGTVESRLPARIRVRREATLELPHIMALIDDPAKTVIEPLGGVTSGMVKLYDFPLMEDGGQLRGWLPSEPLLRQIDAALTALFAAASGKSGDPLLIAVGDGNHSLATAKACYERLKLTLPEAEWRAHPARYALVELVNIHDPALEFEPIHRVLFGVDPQQVAKELQSFFTFGTQGDAQSFTVAGSEQKNRLEVTSPLSSVVAGTVQQFIDGYLSRFGGCVDYIHEEEVALRLCAQADDRVAFLLPAIDKTHFFEAVAVGGALPRKTFSMGEAREKRYYLECRKIGGCEK